MEVFQAGAVTQNSLSYSRFQEAETAFVPSVQDFDKKLAEADAYLQILIDQLKVTLVIVYLDEVCEHCFLCVCALSENYIIAYYYWVVFFHHQACLFCFLSHLVAL